MKKGDIVTITDGSFTRGVIGGKLVREWLNYGDEKGKQYTVVETGCAFPNTGSVGFDGSLPSFNNTVIQAIDSGKVVFIEERFLALVEPKHKILIDLDAHSAWFMCGTVVEISDELYKRIKNETQTG